MNKSRKDMNKAVMTIALCTGLVQAQDAINIDLNIENNNKAEAVAGVRRIELR